MKLTGKISLITGSGRGIGKEIAKKFAREGSTVILISRTKSELENTLNEIKDMGGKGEIHPIDISHNEQVEKLIEKIIQNYSRIDILVNNAAIITPIGRINQINAEEWKKTIEINLFGAFHCIKSVIPHMIKQKYGRIINLSGGGAFNPFPNFSAYSTSKAAVIRLSETLAAELNDYGIHVNSISPGAIRSGMPQKVIHNKESAGNEYERAKKVIDEGGADINKVLELALFLASDESNGLTGKTISAVWDDLDYIKRNISDIQKSDKFTLRRIV